MDLSSVSLSVINHGNVQEGTLSHFFNTDWNIILLIINYKKIFYLNYNKWSKYSYNLAINSVYIYFSTKMGYYKRLFWFAVLQELILETKLEILDLPWNSWPSLYPQLTMAAIWLRSSATSSMRTLDYKSNAIPSSECFLSSINN